MQQPCLHAASGEHRWPEGSFQKCERLDVGDLLYTTQITYEHGEMTGLQAGDDELPGAAFKCSAPQRRKKKETRIHMQPPKQQTSEMLSCMSLKAWQKPG